MSHYLGVLDNVTQQFRLDEAFEMPEQTVARIREIGKETERIATDSKTISALNANSTESIAKNVEKAQTKLFSFYDSLKKAESQYPAGIFDTIKADTEETLTEFDEVKKALVDTLNSGKKPSQELLATIKRLEGSISSFENRLNETRETSNKVFSLNISDVQKLIKKYAELSLRIKNVASQYPSGTFDAVLKNVQGGLQKAQQLEKTLAQTILNENNPATREQIEQYKELTKEFQAYDTEVSTAKDSTDKLRTAVIKNGDSIVDMAKKFVIWQAAATLVMQPLNLIKTALSSINETLVETEDMVVGIRRVLDTDVLPEEISSKVYSIAQRYGQTRDNVADILGNFARSGLSWEESIEATEAAVIALTVAELDATEASEGLIAILKQFNYEAKDLNYIIDLLNKTADTSTAETGDLLTALQKVGSYASEANISLEETVALIAGLSESTAASGANIGNAAKALIAFSTKDTSLNTFAALSEDMNDIVKRYRMGAADVLDIWRQLSVEIQTLSGEQADMLEAFFNTGEGQALEDELGAELSEVYDKLTGVYDTAGTYRKNYFIALLNNIEGVENALDNMNDAEGYSQKESLEYLETYTAKLNTLEAKWQEIANDEQGILGFKKLLVDIGYGVLEVVDATGGLKTVGLATGAVLLRMFGGSVVANVAKLGSSIKNAKTEVIGFLTSIKNGTFVEDTFKSFTSDFKSAWKLAQEANEAQAKAKTANLALSKLETAATRDEAAILAARTAASEADRVATEANTKAKEANLAVSKRLSAIGVGITVATMAISAIVNAVREAEEAAHQARLEIIADYEAVRENANELQKLYEKYKQLSDEINRNAEQNEELSSVESEIVEIFGDKAEVLGLLTKGTEEYTEAVKNLTEAELKEFRQQRVNAAEAAEREFIDTSKVRVKTQVRVSDEDADGLKLLETLSKEGFLTSLITNGYATTSSVLGVSTDDTIEAQIENLRIYQELLDHIDEIREEALKNGDTDYADYLAGSTFRAGLVDFIENTQEGADKYISTQSAVLLDEWELINGEIKTSEQLSEFVAYAIERMGINAEFFSDDVRNAVASMVSLDDATQDTANSAEKLDKKLANITSQYSEIIAALEKARDVDKDRLDYEEKRRAVIEAENELLKAQKELEEAKNNRNIQVYNAATGRYEWQADLKAIDEANEAVESAETQLEQARLDIEEAAYNSIIKELEAGTANEQTIIKLLKEWALASGESNPEFIQKIQEVFAGYGINLKENEPVLMLPNKSNHSDYREVQIYDKGGILHGLGGLKATKEPEAVLPPSVTRQILNPVSNDRFVEFANALGLLFGAFEGMQTLPQAVSNVSGNVTNNNGATYVVNGVTIPESYAQNHSIMELFSLMALNKDD